MKKYVDLKFLNKINACSSGVANFQKQYGDKRVEITEVINECIKLEHLQDANWLIVRVMSKKQGVEYAIFAAEQVINMFKKKYPDDKRPRKAIEAAKDYLKTPCKKTKADAAAAAYAAADAAAAAYAAADADAAAAAAAYAAYAAYAAAADAAAYAYDAAYAAAAAADAAADAAEKGMRIKILENGIKILQK